MNDILTITLNPALDIYSEVEEVNHNIKLRCEAPRREAGGGGLNVSKAIKRLGGNSTALFASAGNNGEELARLLKEEEIDYNQVKLPGNTRENFTIREKSTGFLYRFAMPGAKLGEKDLEKILGSIAECRSCSYVVGSGSLPPGAPVNFYASLAEAVKSNGLKFIADTSGEALKKILEKGAYLIKPNKEEVAALLDWDEEEYDYEEAVRQIMQKYPLENLVLSLGSEGAILATTKEVLRFTTPKVEKKSSVGAGDSMVGGIVYSLSAGNSMVDSVRYGIACGTAAIMTPGTELLYKKDADKIFPQIAIL